MLYRLDYVKCNKADCSCRAHKGHGPYWFAFWSEGSYGQKKLRKKYIGKKLPTLRDVDRISPETRARAGGGEYPGVRIPKAPADDWRTWNRGLDAPPAPGQFAKKKAPTRSRPRPLGRRSSPARSRRRRR